jgi:hypothetical protein
MSRRPHRQNLVVRSSSGRLSDRYRAQVFPLARPRRMRRWLRAGTVLAVMGLMRLAHVARARWRPVLLLGGSTMTVAGIVLSSGLVLAPGIVVLLFALAKGMGAPDCQAAAQLAQARWRG